MLKSFTFVAISLLGMAATSEATLPTPSLASTSKPKIEIQLDVQTQETATKEVAPDNTPKEKWLTCKGCNENEIFVLNALQGQGIFDKNALATIMGNIKQESMFISNICEGGARVSYHQCRSGGFGISQWTSSDRFYGLGQFAARIGGDPSSLETQVKYMFYERDWRMIENGLKTPGKTINDYMRLANRWLRWGIKGPREHYATQYLNKFEYVNINS